MSKLAPHIDEDGKVWLNVLQATKLACGVSQSALWSWAESGSTTWGLPLRTKKVPVTIHRSPRNKEPPPRIRRETRTVILEADVLAVKQCLDEIGKTRPRPWSPADQDALRLAARRTLRSLARAINAQPH